MSATFPERARRADGFAAITAVFILVVLGALGTVLVTVFSAQQRGAAFDALGMQAYQAARAGIEFGSYQALEASSCVDTAIAMPGRLSAFNVRVQCSSTNHGEGGATVRVYEITATACNRASCPQAPDATYVERQLRTTITDIAPGTA